MVEIGSKIIELWHFYILTLESLCDAQVSEPIFFKKFKKILNKQQNLNRKLSIDEIW